MKKHHNIFKDTSLSKDELNKYLSGDLSQEEKLIIEKKIASSDFSMDALEGFENTPGSSLAYQQLSDDFHANLSRKVKKNGKWKFQYSFVIIIVLALTLYGVGHYFLLESEVKREAFNERRKKEKEVVAQKIIKQEILEKNIPPVVELSDGEIDSAVLMPDHKQLLSANIIVESPIKVDIDSSVSDTLQMDLKIKEAIDVKERVEITPVDPVLPDRTKEKVIINNTKTLYLSELLVVDYSDIHSKGIEKTSLQLTGVSADKENKDDTTPSDMQVDMHTVEINYLDFLREAQAKFRNNHFKAALKDYKLILMQYPDDINAHFYSGLCYYNINKLNKAVEHFDRTILHDFNTFKVDAEWYKALCLYESGETSSCITLLNKIANSDSFYAKKAVKLLEKI